METEGEPLDCRVVNGLQKFQDGVNYVSEVEQLVSGFSEQYMKLSCLEKLRSRQRIQEVSKQEFSEQLKKQSLSKNMEKVSIAIESDSER